MTAQQMQTKPLTFVKCDVSGCEHPAKFRVEYSWTKTGEGYNLCQDDLDSQDERGVQYFRRTATSIIALEAVS